ncbi:histidine kinase [Nonlabens sp. MIC269]|uniref:histidine kinase n=1 Tax=Nonlabens sp. MIC269 TaxID=1476901 RepID=UPI000760FA57|nr:histidine kinase [Nonlabens sp. MIC269]
MMKKILVIIILLISCTSLNAQSKFSKTKTEQTSLSISGRVLTEDGKPIVGVNIEGPNGRYASTDSRGNFQIPANYGDRLVIRGIDFETVYHTVYSNDDLEIRVTDEDDSLNNLTYSQAIDSTQIYFNKDPKKTADFLIAALSNNPKSLSKQQQAAAYEKLGDLYFNNKQYDLAIDNFKASINFIANKSVSLKRASALRENGNYQESIKAFIELGPFKNKDDEIKRLKGLADAYAATNDQQQAIAVYQKALLLSEEVGNLNEVTSLNTKIGNNLDRAGQTEKAEGYFNKAISNSTVEGRSNTIVTQSQTADFYNANQQYDKEIALRKKNIQLFEEEAKEKDSITPDREAFSDSSILSNKTAVITPEAPKLTLQKEQLKIATALKEQNKIDDAIDYYLKSLKEAEKNEDLDVLKDASKELSKLYRIKGNSSKALTYSEKYIEAVDQLYLEKENQLEEATRNAKELVAKQTRILTLEKDRKLTDNKLALASAEQALSIEANRRQRWIIYSLGAAVILLLTLAYFMYRNNKQQKINNHLLALKSLRSQMNPHFIFNALNSVNNFIATNDERKANKYLADFSKLMRSVLENSELDFIPASKEIELLNLYLHLEHERFKDKFEFELNVDPSIKESNIPVPPMLLQPIIENAVWHGLRYKKEKGLLKVSFEPHNQSGIKVVIQDNGIGREKSKELKTKHQKKRDSKGLGNIKNRIDLLNELHNKNITLTVEDANLKPDIGTTVIVIIN